MLPVRSDIAAKYSIHPDKIRMIPPKEEAKTGYYAKLFDDLFVKQTK
jgi:hypothetical protein